MMQILDFYMDQMRPPDRRASGRSPELRAFCVNLSKNYPLKSLCKEKIVFLCGGKKIYNNFI
jgi:hypothetical protein